MTFLVPTIEKISLPRTSRDYFSLVAKLLGNVLVKNSIAVWQRRTKILRTVWLSRTHISPKIIVGCSSGRYVNIAGSVDDRQSTLQANNDKERTLQKLCKGFVEYMRKPWLEDIFEPRPSLDRTPGRQTDSRTDGSILTFAFSEIWCVRWLNRFDWSD